MTDRTLAPRAHDADAEIASTLNAKDAEVVPADSVSRRRPSRFPHQPSHATCSLHTTGSVPCPT